MNNFEQKREVAKRCVEDIGYVVNEFGERNAGSDGEKRTAEYFASRLSKVCDSVSTENFDVYPDAFMGWSYIVGTLAVLAFVAYFFSTMVSFLLVVIAIVVFVVQYALGKRFLDPLYKKKESVNVTAIKNCENAPKCRLFFVSSVDCAQEWALLRRLGGTTFTVVILAAFVGLAYTLAIDVARWVLVGELGAKIADGDMLVAGYAGICFLPFWIALFFFAGNGKAVEGANENLSGCEVALGVVEQMSEQRAITRNVEVGVILTGSEQAGLRGAKSWCDVHANDFDDVPTYFVHLGVLKDPNYICVNEKERCGLARADAELVDEILHCTENTDVKCQKSSLRLFGTTDSSVFSQNGFKSVSVTGYDGRKCPDYLHTRYDTHDNVSEICIANAFELCCRLVQRLDGKCD